MSRPPNLCGYCGEIGRTKEHFWGKWIKDVIPEIHPNTNHVVSYRDVFGQQVTKKGVLSRQGPMRRQQLKVPCEKCNTGWMRRTNEATRPTIELLVNDGPIQLSLAEAKRFATWAVMMSMTYEFADQRTMVTQASERSTLMRRLVPPHAWAVMIGLYVDSGWTERQNHRALSLKSRPSTDRPQAQCNLFTIGRTAVATFSGQMFARRTFVKNLADHFHLQVVWPNGLKVGADRYPLNDEDMDRIAKFDLPE